LNNKAFEVALDIEEFAIDIWFKLNL